MLRVFLLILILFFTATSVYASVVINEVAWMGTKNSAQDEWVELFSDTSQNLEGWALATEDSGMVLKLKGTTTAGGYYLIERTDDKTVPDIKADLVSAFGKGLSNAGEILILRDSGGNEVDRVDGSNGWPMGGDSDTKYTLQRAKNDPSRWLTAAPTPKAENANYVKKVVPAKSLPAISSPAASGKSVAQPNAGATAVAAGKGNENNQDQLAMTALNTDHSSLPSGDYFWLVIGLGVGILAGAAFFFAKRYFP